MKRKKSAKQRVFEAAMRWHDALDAYDHVESNEQQIDAARRLDAAEIRLDRACAAVKKERAK